MPAPPYGRFGRKYDVVMLKSRQCGRKGSPFPAAVRRCGQGELYGEQGQYQHEKRDNRSHHGFHVVRAERLS